MKSMSVKLLAIIIACTLWVIFIPGFIAYYNNVYYGSSFRDKFSDLDIKSHLEANQPTIKYYENGEIKNYKNTQRIKITFAGFAEQGLNYVWLESYIILCIYAFLLYYSFRKKSVNRNVFVMTAMIIVLFHSNTWIRNWSPTGKAGRTIYTFVNYDVDTTSFWLQEFRGYIFCFLIAVFWYQFELRRRAASTLIRHTARTLSVQKFERFTKHSKIFFINWQRDMIASIILFLPWTWFYWRNIYFHEDTRFIFPAIVFHSFWVISIVLLSRPFIEMNFCYGVLRQKLHLSFICGEKNDAMINFLENTEVLPKGQFLVTALTTLLSLVSPFLQWLIK
jgi:hypothetical protein